MKIRLDYVTNSSSSSFIVNVNEAVEANIDTIFEHARNSFGDYGDGETYAEDVKEILKTGFEKNPNYTLKQFMKDSRAAFMTSAYDNEDDEGNQIIEQDAEFDEDTFSEYEYHLESVYECYHEIWSHPGDKFILVNEEDHHSVDGGN